MTTTAAVMLTTADADVALCDAAAMAEAGQQAADALGCTVTARDPITDAVIATFEPAPAARKTRISGGWGASGGATCRWRGRDAPQPRQVTPRAGDRHMDAWTSRGRGGSTP